MDLQWLDPCCGPHLQYNAVRPARRILLTISALEEVEKQYQASLISKEPPKEPAAKRASGRAPRREEHPLFDINPRTAWEFLCRVQSVPSGTGISFQKEGEEFSQWKSEYSRAKLAESVPVAPSSFADALLRKLNIAGGKENGGTNGLFGRTRISSSLLIDVQVYQTTRSFPEPLIRIHLESIRKCQQYHLMACLRTSNHFSATLFGGSMSRNPTLYASPPA